MQCLVLSKEILSEENLEKTLLEKRFSPSWLAGTSVGELMFQADYYLKELAMGEHLHQQQILFN